MSGGPKYLSTSAALREALELTELMWAQRQADIGALLASMTPRRTRMVCVSLCAMWASLLETLQEETGVPADQWLVGHREAVAAAMRAGGPLDDD